MLCLGECVLRGFFWGVGVFFNYVEAGRPRPLRVHGEVNRECCVVYGEVNGVYCVV